MKRDRGCAICSGRIAWCAERHIRRGGVLGWAMHFSIRRFQIPSKFSNRACRRKKWASDPGVLGSRNVRPFREVFAQVKL